MDGNLSAVVHTAKQLALLAEALERRSESAVSTQRSAAFALTRSTAYMEGLLKSLGDERAIGDSLSQLAMSPAGRDFRTEGSMQYKELLHQQALEESIQAQQQQQQQQQVGPVLTLGPSE
jgi:hypothetical protein